MTDFLRFARPRAVFLAVALTAVAAAPSAAQLRTQQVTGVVQDATTGLPLADAVLRVRGELDAARSARDGRFILRDVPSGFWTLEVVAPGYAPATFEMMLEPGGFAEMELRLDRAGTGTSSEGSALVPAPGGGTRAAPRTRRTSFDWNQDPQGHPFLRTFAGAAAGNALGLVAGLAVGRQCVFVEERTDEIDFSCGHAGVVGAGVAAVALPALGSAIGAGFGGQTSASRGRLVPALVGGAMGVIPGYIFSLSTVGDGVETMNAVGVGFLVIGAPLVTTFADRLFRTLR